MEFSEVLQRLEVESGRGRGHVPADWLQGRTSCGGLEAALAYQAMRSVLPAAWPLRELQVAFIGPVAAQAECRLSSGGALATVVIGTYGAPRPSSLTWPMPASSLSLTLEIVGREYDAAPGRWWCVEVAVTAGGEGYLHQTATLFDPVGRPIALNRQIVVIYDAP